MHGDVDLTNIFVPNVEQTYVSRDPEHFHFFYPAASVPIGLYLDDTKYPYSLVAFRRAISQAVDREALSGRRVRLRAPGGCDRHQPHLEHVDRSGVGRRGEAARDLRPGDAAKQTLLDAGLQLRRTTPSSTRGATAVRIKAKYRRLDRLGDAWQMIARNLGDIGIAVDVQLVPTWGDWQPDAFSTRVATLLWNNAIRADAVRLLHGSTSTGPRSSRPARMRGTGNWEHFQSPEGTRLLTSASGTP